VLVVEISRTSLALDRKKAPIYARADVPAYWLLDMNSRRLEIHSEPHEDGRYGLVRVLAETDTVSPPEKQLTWRVADLFA
jgi:Uma2 family endonuclease